MSKLRDELIAENEKINWEPAHIKEGRFGEWLREVKDWAISRERYWGTPMPVWENAKKEKLVIGSIEELKKYSKTPITKIIFVRHGQSENNVLLMSSSAVDKHPLTELGLKQAEAAAENLIKENVDVVFSSPVLRAKQTAEIYIKKAGLQIIVDERLSEINSGNWEDKSQNDPTIKMSRDLYKALPTNDRYLVKRGETGESWRDLEIRVQDFLDEVLNKYQGKTILCFAHQGTDEIALKLLQKLSNDYAAETVFHEINNGEILPIYVDSRTNKGIDLHRPFIDDITLEKDGEIFNRVKEVMDVWFDSGSMPFAEDHYPFENKDYVDNVGYPADFISEAVDQTRGWFYTLLAVGVLMGRGTAYKNCICLGHILDDKGKKMSKSIGNIVNPWEMMDKYGVDTLRLWMYSVNQPGDSKNFDEKTVAELQNKVFTLISNCYKFYELYSESLKEGFDPKKSENILDKWILARLNELIKKGTIDLDNYKIFEPARALRDFVADLSTWYIRRSRDRFKGEDEEDKQFALTTTKHVFIELAKFMAPMTPFFAEDLYQKVGGEKASVHLEDWPIIEDIDSKVLDFMNITRDVVTLGLEARQKANIKVRQPLQSLTITQELPSEFLELIKDEVNIKTIELGEEIKLDTNITPELKKEGDFREFVRYVQGLRKDADLLPGDLVTLSVPEKDKETIVGFEDELKKVAGIKDIGFKGEEIKIEK
jgi:isoleucyl-tRNA synthetase